jgi:hypothetical protein
VSDNWRLWIENPSPELESRLRDELAATDLTSGDGHLIVWLDTADEAREAGESVQRLIDVEAIAESVNVEHWSHAKQEWEPSAADDTEEVPDDAAEEADAVEVWEVVVKSSSRAAARGLAERLAQRGLEARRRWRGVVLECVGRAAAEQLATDLRFDVETGTAISVRRAVGGGVYVPGGDIGGRPA